MVQVGPRPDYVTETRATVRVHPVVVFCSLLLCSFPNHGKLVCSAILENSNNKPHVVRHWLSPVGIAAVECEIKMKRFADSRNNAFYKLIWAIRVAYLIDDLGILNLFPMSP